MSGCRQRIVIAGMPCTFSRAVFGRLTEHMAGHGADLGGGILASRIAPAGLDALRSLGVDRPAPGVVVRDRREFGGELLGKWLRDLTPDLVIVACFPWQVPDELRAVPARGWLNVHPSLLPAYRGPEPVFWTVRDGVQRTGVTLHLMDDGLDTGPIVAQAGIVVGEATSVELERSLAARAVDLLLEVVGLDAIAARPQSSSPARGAPLIRGDDLVVPNTGSPTEAVRWMRAVADQYGPLTIRDHVTGHPLATVNSRDDVFVVSDDSSNVGDPGLAQIPWSGGAILIRTESAVRPLGFQPRPESRERTP